METRSLEEELEDLEKTLPIVNGKRMHCSRFDRTSNQFVLSEPRLSTAVKYHKHAIVGCWL